LTWVTPFGAALLGSVDGEHELRRIERPTNLTRCIPEPLLQRGNVLERSDLGGSLDARHLVGPEGWIDALNEHRLIVGTAAIVERADSAIPPE
jgi:hypothetical protein